MWTKVQGSITGFKQCGNSANSSQQGYLYAPVTQLFVNQIFPRQEIDYLQLKGSPPFTQENLSGALDIISPTSGQCLGDLVLAAAHQLVYIGLATTILTVQRLQVSRLEETFWVALLCVSLKGYKYLKSDYFA